MAGTLTHDDLVGIQNAFTAALRSPEARRTFSSMPSGGGASSAVSSATGAIGSLGDAAANAASRYNTLESNFNALEDVLEEQAKVNRKLADGGTGFSNSLLDMRNGAIQSRLELDELSDVLIDNSRNLAGLGGSATRGAEAFTRLSKGFFESRMTDELSEMGYSFREINELLLDQVSVSRYRTMVDEESRKEAYQSTVAFAKELDLTAKLTGKSRKQQMEEMRDKENNAKVAARIAMIEATQGKAAADAVRAKYEQALAVATRHGMQDVFKEAFAKEGAVTSEKGRSMMAMGGAGGMDFAKIGADLSKANVAGIDEALTNAGNEMVSLQKSATFQQMVLFSDNIPKFGDAALNIAMSNQALSDAATSIQQQSEKAGGKISIPDAYRKSLDDAALSAKGMKTGFDEAGKATQEYVGGLNKAIVELQTTFKTAKAGLAEGLTVPRAGEKSAAQYINELGEKLATSLSTSTNIAAPISDFTRDVTKAIGDSGSSMLAELRYISKYTGELATKLLPQSITQPTPQPPSPQPAPLELQHYATGTPGVHGTMFNDFGKGQLAYLDNIEAVLTPEHIDNLVKGVQMSTMADIAKNFSQVKIPETENVIQDITPVQNITNNVSVKPQNNQAVMVNAVTAMQDRVKQLTDTFAKQPTTDNTKKPEPTNVRDDIAAGFNQIKMNDHAAMLEKFKMAFPPPAKEYKNENTITDSDLSKIAEMTGKFGRKEMMDESLGPAFYHPFRELSDNVTKAFKEGRGQEINDLLNAYNVKFNVDTSSMEKAQSDIKSSLSSISTDMTSTVSQEKEIQENANKIKIDRAKNSSEQLQSIPETLVSNILPKINDLSIKIGENIPEAAPFINDITTAFDGIAKNFTAQSTAFSDTWNDANKNLSDISKTQSVMFTDSWGEINNSIPDISKKITPPSTPVSPETPPKKSAVSTTQAMPSLDMVNFMPRNQTPKASEEASKKESAPQETQKPSEQPKQPQEQPKKEIAPPVAPPKKDNSDAILSQLQLLNSQMKQLIEQHDDLGRKQVKATKANSGNLMPT